MRPPLVLGALAVTAVLTGALALHPVPPDAPLRPLAGSVPHWPAGVQRTGTARTGSVSFSVLLAPDRLAGAPSIRGWLQDHGLHAAPVRPAAASIPVEGPVDQVADAFHTTFARYRTAQGTVVTAPERPLSVPRELAAVTGIAGVVVADTIRPTEVARGTSPTVRGHVLADDGTCAAYWGEKVTTDWPASVVVDHRSNALCGYGPAQLREVHHLPADVTGRGARIAIVAAFDDPDVEQDTDTYARATGTQPFTAGQYRNHAPDAPDVDRCGGPEAWTEEQHLDVQAVHAMAPDAIVDYWGAADCGTTAMYSRILDVVEDGHADVISLSFGSTEQLDTADDRALLNRVLVEAASLGISVFASSGNDGDYSDAGDHGAGASVASPASSPYVTAVGGTSTGLAADGSVAVEAGWETQTRFARNGAVIPPGFAYGAGGGESGTSARPTWQRDDIRRGGTGRLVPDVASIADPDTGFVTYGPHHGRTEYAAHGGTSLATPMVASMVAMSKAVTGRRIGLASPALFALRGTAALRDVRPTSAATWSPRGPDAGALWPETIAMWDTRPQSLQSGPGWDDVTGLGVPDGRAFIEQFGATEAGR
ncbi:pro-kumamolisin-like protein [Curtobacterium sp. AG1037]|uniref:S53 family peptidase n=1 Tax=Curtobacterium sp. AG1037 TaxID=2183990 RepID=UPI000E0B0385|nr:S53 family peptidase [Curtobacterium sp. AG1037]RDH94921.1 pro-kumamolisin-like protein [Curtobacterium sp. AG1037]